MGCVGNSVPAEGTARAKPLRPELDIQGAAGTLVAGIKFKAGEAGHEGPGGRGSRSCRAKGPCRHSGFYLERTGCRGRGRSRKLGEIIGTRPRWKQ